MDIHICKSVKFRAAIKVSATYHYHPDVFGSVLSCHWITYPPTIKDILILMSNVKSFIICHQLYHNGFVSSCGNTARCMVQAYWHSIYRCYLSKILLRNFTAFTCLCLLVNQRCYQWSLLQQRMWNFGCSDRSNRLLYNMWQLLWAPLYIVLLGYSNRDSICRIMLRWLYG